MKKQITLLIAICSIIFGASAQRIVEKNVPVVSGQDIELEFNYAELIKVTKWDKNEIYVKASVSINCDEDNDIFKLEVENKADNIRISSDYGDLKKITKKYILKEDKDGNTYINGRTLSINTFYEVNVPEDVELYINSISGNVEIDDYSSGVLRIKLISGDIDIKKIEGPLYAKSISGFVDLSLGSDQKVDLRMKTVTGEIYTNLDIDFDKIGTNMGVVGSKVAGTINGGGKEIELESVSGDIYLRKR